MCQNLRTIYNPYSRRKIVVRCGHCDACKQEKALQRTTRIRNNYSDGTLVLFLTLTYSNDYIPYIDKNQLRSDDLDVNIYRNCDCRYTFSRYSGYSFRKEYGKRVIDKVFLQPYERTDSVIKSLPSVVNGNKDYCSVCYLPDGQNFIKRLRQIISRNYGIKQRFSYFLCSEYGASSKRAHLHLLLFIPACYEQEFRKAIVTAWPYADSTRTKNYIEVARNAASYVSSYVNGNSCLPSCLQVSKFASKHTYSRNFGLLLDCFSLRSLLHKIDTGNLYYYSQQKFDGASCVNKHLVPEYVLNRYFPKHKGFGWLSQSQLFDVLLKPERIGSFSDVDVPQILNIHGSKFSYVVTNNHGSRLDNPLYHYSSRETYQIYVSLENCYQRFLAETGLSRYDYALYYMRAWSLRSSLALRDSYEDVSDFSDFYLNAVEYVDNPLACPTLDVETIQTNPNALTDVMTKHFSLLEMFDRYDKTKKVTNYVHSHLDYYV